MFVGCRAELRSLLETHLKEEREQAKLGRHLSGFLHLTHHVMALFGFPEPNLHPEQLAKNNKQSPTRQELTKTNKQTSTTAAITKNAQQMSTESQSQQ